MSVYPKNTKVSRAENLMVFHMNIILSVPCGLKGKGVAYIREYSPKNHLGVLLCI